MWQLQRKLARANSATMTTELFQSAARNLILAVFGIYLLWAFHPGGQPPCRFGASNVDNYASSCAAVCAGIICVVQKFLFGAAPLASRRVHCNYHGRLSV